MSIVLCPRCHVPNEQQSDLAKTWPLRTQQESQQAYQVAQALREADNHTEAEQLMKEYGLYEISVCILYAISLAYCLHGM